jgi:catechol 2,3-dioxygenase-like lactoylglutathione lyase family enzyme
MDAANVAPIAPTLHPSVRPKGATMAHGIEMAGLYVRDQDEALAFYVDKLGLRVHTDVRNGDYRWLTVQHPDQPAFQLGLFTPGPPVHDAATAQALRDMVAKGAMPPLVLAVDDCRATCERLRARGVEFTQEPEDRYGTVDAAFRDPSGNAWRIVEARRRPSPVNC